MSTTDNILLIVVDQLRADYDKRLRQCSKLLQFHCTCDTDSFPASTEAMHANISTGLYPKDHGFVSRNIKDGKSGLDQLIMKLRRKEVPSLASLGVENGFGVYIIGGKEETVKVMGDERDCQLMMHYDKDSGIFVPVRASEDIQSLISQLTKDEGHVSKDKKGWDKGVLGAFEEIYPFVKSRDSFFILTLSSLDTIGHDFGAHSDEVYKHLTLLDKSIHSLVRDIGNPPTIIIGDHGCRNVSRYLIEPTDDNPNSIKVYNVSGNSVVFEKEYRMESFDGIEDIQYDGGILRIWLKRGKSLSESDAEFLSKYGYVFPYYIDSGSADDDVIRLYENSRHENLGDVFVVGMEDSTFCKLRWIIDKETREKIYKRKDLERNKLPIGEHGTYHPDDRKVCFLSNAHPVRTISSNTDVYNLIKSMMKGQINQ